MHQRGGMEVSAALVAGIAAGLAVAVPVGAIGVLLLRDGIERGFRRGWPAAAGVAAADLAYCVLAIALGAVAGPLVRSLQPWPALVGGLILIGIALRGLAGATRPAVPPARGVAAKAGVRFVVFLGLTLVNPATFVYFAAITTAIDAIAASPVSAAAFALGVAFSSFAWQLLLVLAGSLLRAGARDRVRGVTVIVGNVMVGAFGIVIITAALSG
jgi:threonine/homoserine/homoserine lactone efflux protein